MRKKILAVTCGLSLLIAAGACKKKEEQPVPQTGAPGQQQQLPPGQPMMPQQGMPPQGMPPQGMQQPGGQPNIIVPKGETTVTVPDSVKGRWKAVVLVVENKGTNKTADYTVNLHSEFKIPNTDLRITVGDFLPDFRMEGLNITSASNEPNNPAVGVRVDEGGKQIFPAPGKKWGWLYGKFPTMHPFEHPKYAIVLKSAVPKG